MKYEVVIYFRGNPSGMRFEATEGEWFQINMLMNDQDIKVLDIDLTTDTKLKFYKSSVSHMIITKKEN